MNERDNETEIFYTLTEIIKEHEEYIEIESKAKFNDKEYINREKKYVQILKTIHDEILPEYYKRRIRKRG